MIRSINDRLPRLLFVAVLSVMSSSGALLSQENAPQVTPDSQPESTAPLTLTLQDALARAKQVNPEYRSAVTEFGLAKEDKVQGRAALLPSVNYTTSFLYTQGNGSSSGRFIANNGVHEYIAQGNAHEDLSLANFADFRRRQFAEAAARARAEVAARGLVVTVVQAYYGFVIAQHKYATEQRAADEARHFLDISQKLEKGGEVAHSDVIKAQIQANQQQRDLQEAELMMNKGRLGLAVLVFRDFNENFAVVDDLQVPEPLPSFQDAQTAAANKNPELRAAVAMLQAARQEVVGAWQGFFPSLSLDYFYGVDGNQFATENPQDIRNLGYAATATLQLPVWNWGANRSKLKQATLRRTQAQVELSATQREMLANLRNFYNEAQTARSELESLDQSAQLAADSLRLTTLRYQAGESSVLEVVDAQNTATAARNAFHDGQARYRLALATLQTLTGNF